MNLTETQEARAKALHIDSFVFDFSPHGEPFVLTQPVVRAMREGIANRERLAGVLRRMWIARLSELAVDPEARADAAALWRASGVNAVQATLGGMELDIDHWDALLRDAARWHERARLGGLTVCTSADDLREAWKANTVGVTLGLQDTLAIGTDLSRLETLYGLGVRVIQLTYNRRNLIGDGCTERYQSGLSRFGLDFVRELNRLGIVVDVSHSGLGTTLDALEASESPVAFTHVCAGALYDHPRAKSDDELKLLAERDGYAGILAYPFFLSQKPGAGIEVMVAHLQHVAGIIGTSRVGIATDWGFWSTDFPSELRDAALDQLTAMGFRPEDGVTLNVALGEFVAWSDWPQLTRGLVAGGFGDDEIRGFLGNNWLAFLDRAGVRS